MNIIFNNYFVNKFQLKMAVVDDENPLLTVLAKMLNVKTNNILFNCNLTRQLKCTALHLFLFKL